MNTLTISQIFSNLEFYKQNYLSILNSPTSYFTEVEGAIVDVFPFKKHHLVLGELLQLWFSEKWSIDHDQSFTLEQYLAANDLKANLNKLYIYSIKGNAILGTNKSLAWLNESNAVSEILLKSPLKYYVECLSCSRPSKHLFNKQLAV
ncbi:hypothetical protein [Acinetobacter sp. Ver3]|uniref:hypothetical protein n=1 Tax=Acinetobacter sp. Ver3 TaxID=466088 RepID=UPI00044CF7DD|nr:hypothetical protein [Acinetobacter sp. Ver3]EZQ10095.1 hypothetical protein CL42_08715 [Acinetobacter sp. Ver3]